MALINLLPLLEVGPLAKLGVFFSSGRINFVSKFYAWRDM